MTRCLANAAGRREAARPMRVVRGVLVVLSMSGCAATAPQQHPNPVRRSFEQSVAAARGQPLVLRWNPAPCPCPPFELLVGGRWLRAELVGGGIDSEAFAAWVRSLAWTPIEALPVTVDVDGRVENELVRTAQGGYAVRIEVSAVRTAPVDTPKESATGEDSEGTPVPPTTPIKPP